MAAIVVARNTQAAVAGIVSGLGVLVEKFRAFVEMRMAGASEKTKAWQGATP
jgi:hypothetical protein